MMKPVVTFIPRQPYLIPKSAPTMFLRKSRPSHKSALTSFLTTYVFISFGTYPRIHLCAHSGRDVLSMTKATSALLFYALLTPEGPCSINYPVSLSSLTELVPSLAQRHIFQSFLFYKHPSFTPQLLLLQL